MATNAGSHAAPPQSTPPRPGMVWIPGGTFRMGSDRFYPEERPVREVRVDGFWIDRHPVTNEQFSRFVAATGYVTVAERPPDPALYPGAPPENLVAGSMVFMPTSGPVDLEQLARTGGPGPPGRTGAIPAARKAPSRGWPTIPWCRWRWPTSRPIAPGRARRCPRKRSGSMRRAAGSTAPIFTWGNEERPEWSVHGQHLAGPFPLAEHEGGWVRLHLAGRQLSRQRLRACSTWPATSGNGPRTGTPSPQSSRCHIGCCVPAEPARRRARGEHQPAPRPVPHPAQGRQRRIAPVRSELLLPLPPGGAPAAGHRHRHEPPRVPLRRPNTDRS